MQAQMLEQINTLINRVYAIAEAQGTERPRKIPYRMLQAFILTSDAFMSMTAEDAADIMGVEVKSVYDYLYRAGKDPNLASFAQLWACKQDHGSFKHPFDVDRVDETDIVWVF